MKVETLTIEGMHCGHCAAMIKKSLEMLNGVKNADVSLGKATVIYDEELNDKDDIEGAVTRFGYKISTD
ncbi:MAG: heavy metal-associated domain-containing protein [Nitrospirota bacterium]|jgi:copper chaperone CopZ